MSGRFFFFNDTATTEIYTLSLHDALPILKSSDGWTEIGPSTIHRRAPDTERPRSEEHTSELQSRLHLVCRLLLEKKKTRRESSPGRRHDGDRRARAERAHPPRPRESPAGT